MGYTGSSLWVGQPSKEIIQQEIGQNNELLRIEGSRVCSCAIRNKTTNEVWGCVVLVHRYPDEVTVKFVEESMGPCEAKASAKLISLLSPLRENDEYARGWRERCLANAGKPKIKPNVLITLDAPLGFAGGRYQFKYFMKVGRRMYACDEKGENAKRVTGFKPEKYNWTQD